VCVCVCVCVYVCSISLTDMALIDIAEARSSFGISFG
jgi:hypothetical protein